jgi:hypothetical protein
VLVNQIHDSRAQLAGDDYRSVGGASEMKANSIQFSKLHEEKEFSVLVPELCRIG